ncbi:TetR family transcriptional regulator [Paenibacillus sp. LMG 31458]|uniref:TetR family transcriptional regulator n=2 Tax=Paenibacillus phytorum TaxID=2654977 RepID=A0ABX1XRP6_9BACL|nr:TetR family transcriptional regulator [Paenibacillus phytorum]
MRKIADKLRVKTASLYYHVKNKEELMQLLTDRIYMLKNHIQGFVAEEVQLQAKARNHHSSYEEMGEQYDQFYRQLPEERFPNMIHQASYTTKTNWENEFHIGLSVLIDGFSAKLMRGKAREPYLIKLDHCANAER